MEHNEGLHSNNEHNKIQDGGTAVRVIDHRPLQISINDTKQPTMLHDQEWDLHPRLNDLAPSRGKGG